MSEKPEQTGRGWGLYVVWSIVPLELYVGIAGPVMRYRMSVHGSNYFLTMMQMPLWKAAELPVIGKPLAAYLNLWLPEPYQR